MANRNERKLHKRKCDATGKNIISAYHADAPFKVYKNDFWWSDQWNALDYGRDFDFSRPFFEQYAELQKVVPREGTSVFNSENCEYNGHIRESRNCYLNALVYRCEDIDYCYWMVNVKNAIDCYLLIDSEICYWCIDTIKAYDCIGLQEGFNCSECYFSFQLVGCHNCLFCTNLKNKSFHIMNEPCSKEEFEAAKKEIFDGTHASFWNAMEKFNQLKKNTVHRYAHNINCENVTGDHMAGCRNCADCFEGFDSENCSNCVSLDHSHDVHNCYSAGWPGCDKIYNSVVTRGSTDIAFCIYTFFSSSLRYCDSSHRADNCFGCIGMQHKQYCILNKQYSKDEYLKLLPRINKHMKQTNEFGNFFPPSLSFFTYNETAAQDYFPLDEKHALALGFKWRKDEKKDYQPPTVSVMPENSSDADFNFTKEILACEDCRKNYRIIERELSFYHKHGLPIPRKCHDCRHKIRSNMRNALKLFSDKCDNCGVDIKTTYGKRRVEKLLVSLATVYCEKCYLSSIE